MLLVIEIVNVSSCLNAFKQRISEGVVASNRNALIQVIKVIVIKGKSKG